MSESQENPYASPEAALHPPAGPEHAALKRPLSPKVLGILSIVFAVLGALGGVMSLALQSNNPQQEEIMRAMGYSPSYVFYSQIFGLFSSIYLLVTGIGLVSYRKFGRIAFNIYAWFTIVMTIGNVGYLCLNADFDASNPAMLGGLIGGVIGGCAGLIFPVLGLIFLNKDAVKASLK